MSQADDTIRSCLDENAPDAVAAYVFGSRGRDEARPGSDLDLGLLLAEAPEATLQGLRLDLRDRLSDRLGIDVDLVIMNGAPVDLIHRILRDGRLVLDRDPSRRIRFEVRARNEYFDLLPILREYRKAR